MRGIGHHDDIFSYTDTEYPDSLAFITFNKLGKTGFVDYRKKCENGL